MNKDLTHLFESRPYKDLEDCIKDYIRKFCSKNTESVKNYKRYGKLVPCHECRGEGKIWHSGDYREEGEWGDCSKCNNTGVLARDVWREEYDKKIQRWKEQDIKYHKYNEIYVRAFNKLTKEERDIFSHYSS